MQIIKSLAKLLLFIFPVSAFAQSTYLEKGTKDYQFLDRMEIKAQSNPDFNFLTVKPYNRKAIVNQMEAIDSTGHLVDSVTGLMSYPEWHLTKVDEHNLHSFLMNNTEWVTEKKIDFESKKPVFNTFYKSKTNFIEHSSKDFFITANPIIQYNQSYQPNFHENLFLNSKGVSVRGRIANKIGFYTYLTDNQERGPQFFQDRIDSFHAVPGEGYYKAFKSTGVDYFDARGYITFKAAKYIDVQFGQDKNFIGNGYRSLFLSDYSNSYLFLKLNTKIWKLNYENIFMELIPKYVKTVDTLLPRKYAAMHHLSMNVTKWLNIGLFEGVTFGRSNHFDFAYLNPIIFYVAAQNNIGSPDKSHVGLDFKANVAHKAQIYGQLLLDEFHLDVLKNTPNNWANKWGIQLGVKYVDAFGVDNLDFQLEANRVRPFTYTSSNTISDYTHYNQPLAHPLGANFQEIIAIVNYQPTKRWTINGKVFYYYQGLDSVGVDYGSNPLRDYNQRQKQDGYFIGSGNKATCINGIFRASYELRENLYLDASYQYRNYKTQSGIGQSTINMLTLGVRLNMFKREYDY